MSKIVEAINAMIDNSGKISNVLQDGNEYYFLYKDKYKWSITESPESRQYQLFFYPSENLTLGYIKGISEANQHLDLVRYSTDAVKTKEALESFRELYQVVKEKLYGVDAVLNDILSDNAEFKKGFFEE